MERIIQFLDEVDEIVVFLRYFADGLVRRIVVQPGLLSMAIAGALLPV